MDDDAFFTMPDIATELVNVDNSSASDDDKLAKKQEVMQDYGVKSSRIHSMNHLLKAYSLFAFFIEYLIMDFIVKIFFEQSFRIIYVRRFSSGLLHSIDSFATVLLEASTQTYPSVTLHFFFFFLMSSSIFFEVVILVFQKKCRSSSIFLFF